MTAFAQQAQTAQAYGDPSTLKVTAKMIKGMKMAVVTFMGIECLLAFFCIVGVVIFKGNPVIQIIGPTILFAYSFVVLIVLRAMWREFSTKMQLLN